MKNLPDIWMISASYYPYIGGGEKQLQGLAEQLIANGWQVSVLTRRHTKHNNFLPPSIEIIRGVSVYRQPSWGPAKIGSICFVITSLFFLARRGRRLVLHAHGCGAPALIAILAAKLLGGKALTKLRSGIDYYVALRQSRFRRWFLNYQFRNVDKLIVVNQALKDQLEAWGIPAERVIIFPNSIDTQQYCPATDGRAKSMRQQILPDIDTGRQIFLYLGRLVREKGIDTLLSAWAKLPQEIRISCFLLIAGDGELREALQTQAANLHVNESVRFLGTRTDVLDLLLEADVFILPSRIEGLSNAMIEAMACSLPLVCTAVGGTPEWVTDEINGLLCPPDDPDQMRDAIMAMLQNKDRWADMGALSRKLVEERLSWNKTVTIIEHEYLAVAG